MTLEHLVGHGGGSDAPAAVSVDRVSKVFRSRTGETKALDALSLEVAPGEFLVLLGPSGCGKTTLLRSIGGLEYPDSGEISISGKLMQSTSRRTSVPPEGRGVGMVFQSYALWPHMTVFDNVAFPLASRRVGRAATDERVRRALGVVGCEALADRYPSQLSGGQQQRTALARAIVGESSVVLLDEPLSNVDAKVREQLRIELLTLQRELGFAAVYVTHDQTEAVVLGDRIAVMELGKIVQIGPPADIYDHPRTRYVASFVGSGNFLSGTVRERRDRAVIVDSVIGPLRAETEDPSVAVGQQVEAFVRPERCRTGPAEQDANRFEGVVERALFFGPNWEYLVRIAGQRLVTWVPERLDVRAGDPVSLWLRPRDVRVLRIE